MVVRTVMRTSEGESSSICSIQGRRMNVVGPSGTIERDRVEHVHALLPVVHEELECELLHARGEHFVQR